MNRTEALAYLTRCADNSGVHWYQGHPWEPVETCPTCHGTNDAGHLGTPGSRYGYNSAQCAPIAYRHAMIISGESLTEDYLDHSMSMVVNDHDGIETDIQAYAAELAGANIDAMVRGYLDCQLWAQSDYDHPSCDCHANDPQNACHNYNLDENYCISDISDDYVESVRSEIAALVAEHPLAVRMYLAAHEATHARARYNRNELFGHDFYLTREHHGAGFWDRGLGELGEYLTKISDYTGEASDLWDNGNGELTT